MDACTPFSLLVQTSKRLSSHVPRGVTLKRGTEVPLRCRCGVWGESKHPSAFFGVKTRFLGVQEMGFASPAFEGSGFSVQGVGDENSERCRYRSLRREDSAPRASRPTKDAPSGHGIPEGGVLICCVVVGVSVEPSL